MVITETFDLIADLHGGPSGHVYGEVTFSYDPTMTYFHDPALSVAPIGQLPGLLTSPLAFSFSPATQVLILATDAPDIAATIRHAVSDPTGVTFAYTDPAGVLTTVAPPYFQVLAQIPEPPMIGLALALGLVVILMKRRPE